MVGIGTRRNRIDVDNCHRRDIDYVDKSAAVVPYYRRLRTWVIDRPIKSNLASFVVRRGKIARGFNRYRRGGFPDSRVTRYRRRRAAKRSYPVGKRYGVAKARVDIRIVSRVYSMNGEPPATVVTLDPNTRSV